MTIFIFFFPSSINNTYIIYIPNIFYYSQKIKPVNYLSTIIIIKIRAIQPDSEDPIRSFTNTTKATFFPALCL